MDVNDKKDLCSPREFKGKIEKATKWCIDCKEPLCVSCFENHNAHRYSRNHHVIPVEGNQWLESLKIPLNEYCEVHDHEKDLYCSSHSEIICLTCTQTTYGKREPAFRLSDVTTNAKTSTLFSILETNIVDVVNELKDIIRDKEKNKVEIEKQKIAILDTIKNIRKFINNKLDQEEKKITEELNAKCERSHLEIDNYVKFLNAILS